MADGSGGAEEAGVEGTVAAVARRRAERGRHPAQKRKLSPLLARASGRGGNRGNEIGRAHV